MNAPLPLLLSKTLAIELDDRAHRQTEVVTALSAVLPKHALLWHREDTTPYECDGLTAYREQPLVVALPETEAQVAAVLRECHRLSVPVVARGAGTGLSGGALPHRLGVTLSLAKFNKILKIDSTARTATAFLSIVGLGFSGWLTYVEVAELNAICIWCVGSAICMALLAALATARPLRAPAH